jgi:hypothetical protein
VYVFAGLCTVLVCAMYIVYNKHKKYAAYAAGLTMFQWYDYDIRVNVINRGTLPWLTSCRCSTYLAGIQPAVLQRNEKSVSNEGTELPAVSSGYTTSGSPTERKICQQ